MVSWRKALCASAILLLMAAGPVRAGGQEPDPPDAAQLPAPASGRQEPFVRRGAVEISGFAGWIGGNPLAGGGALLTPNVTGNPSASTPLFTVALDERSTSAVGGRLAYNLTRMFAVEGTFTYAHPLIRTTISGDAEASAVSPFTIGEIREVFVEASLVAHLNALTFASGRAVPFVSAGGGYLRQVFRNSNDLITGQVYDVGAGLKFFFSRRLGARGDVREYLRTRGPDDRKKIRGSKAGLGSIFFVF